MQNVWAISLSHFWQLRDPGCPLVIRTFCFLRRSAFYGRSSGRDNIIGFAKKSAKALKWPPLHGY